MVHAGSNTHPVTLPRGRPFYTFRDIPKEDEKTPRARRRARGNLRKLLREATYYPVPYLFVLCRLATSPSRLRRLTAPVLLFAPHLYWTIYASREANCSISNKLAIVGPLASIRDHQPQLPPHTYPPTFSPLVSETVPPLGSESKGAVCRRLGSKRSQGGNGGGG
jgi:hypothetical protein